MSKSNVDIFDINIGSWQNDGAKPEQDDDKVSFHGLL